MAGEDIGEPVDAMDAEDPARALTYDLSGADADSFDIDSTTGQLQTKAALDHETKDTYMVTVTVSDGKDAEDNVDLTFDDEITVTIMVTDVNEAPAFADETATLSVAENTSPGANIGAPVAAMDVDGDTLEYSLDAANRTLFEIDDKTGQLKTMAALDYEIQTDYEVTVTATDDGPLTDTITVTINVRNVSVANGDTEVENSAPAFNDGPSTTREVDENTAADMNIGAPVAARDVDGDTLEYSLDAANRILFEIDEDTGQLKTMAALDYEDTTSYMLTVSVKDSKGADGTAAPDEVDDDEIRVTITVTDVNEAPAFAAPTATRMVDENTAAGANISEGGGPVVATDVDSGDTDTLTYTLGGTHADSFDIDG